MLGAGESLEDSGVSVFRSREDEYVLTTKQRPKDTTQWHDIQQKIGNIPQDPEDEQAESAEYIGPAPAFSLEEAQKQAREERSKLEEFDLEEDEEEQRIMQEMLEERMRSMGVLKNSDLPGFGSMKNITASSFIEEVTQASREHPVICLLFLKNQAASTLLESRLNGVVKRFPKTKFCRVPGQEAIPGYPARNLPTLLVYRNGDPIGQVVGLSPLGGDSTTEEDVEWALAGIGGIESEMKEHPRMAKMQESLGQLFGRRGGKSKDNESDSDDD